MKQTISTASQFRDAFRAMDRHGNFSYEGMELLFDYFEELDPDMELDVVSICCDYAESTTDEINDAYDVEGSTMEWLEENTTVIGTTDAGTIVYQQF